MFSVASNKLHLLTIIGFPSEGDPPTGLYRVIQIFHRKILLERDVVWSL
jgi:hypothetical protein